MHLLMRVVWRVVTSCERERRGGEAVPFLSGRGMTMGRGSGRECRRRVRTRVKGVNARASRSDSHSKLEPEREQDRERTAVNRYASSSDSHRVVMHHTQLPDNWIFALSTDLSYIVSLVLFPFFFFSSLSRPIRHHSPAKE